LCRLAAQATGRREQVADELSSLPAVHVLNQNSLTRPIEERIRNGAMLCACLLCDRVALLSQPCVQQVSKWRSFARSDPKEVG
jgi:hypothetical protein